MSFKGDFTKASEINKSVMRPGIIHSIDQYPFNWVKATNLDSKADNQRIGRVLAALNSAGLTEQVEENSNYTSYEINAALEPENGEKSLTVALGEAEKRYDKTIQKALNRHGRDQNTVVEDILTYGINTEESGKLKVLKTYSDDTINFLDDISMIQNLDTHEITADTEDIQYLQNNIHLLL